MATNKLNISKAVDAELAQQVDNQQMQDVAQQVENQELGNIIEDVETKRQTTTSDDMSVDDLYPNPYGMYGMGAYGTGRNTYDALPIRQGTFGGPMIGNVPIYASPGIMPDTSMIGARRKALEKEALRHIKKAEAFKAMPDKVPVGYKDLFNERYYAGLNDFVKRSQSLHGMKWASALENQGTDIGREFSQFKSEMSRISSTANQVYKSANDIIAAYGNSTKDGYVSQPTYDLARDLIVATEEMRQGLTDPRKLIDIQDQLIVGQNLDKVLQQYYIKQIQPRVTQKIRDLEQSTGDKLSQSGIDNVYQEVTKQWLQNNKAGDLANMLRSERIGIANRYDETQLTKYIKAYFGGKYLEQGKSVGQSGGGAKKVSSVSTFLVDNIGKAYPKSGFKNTNIQRGKDGGVNVTGRAGRLSIDQYGNMKYVRGDDSRSMLETTADVNMSDVGEGTNVTKSDVYEMTAKSPKWAGIVKNNLPSEETVVEAVKNINTGLDKYKKQPDINKSLELLNTINKEVGGVNVGNGTILTNANISGNKFSLSFSTIDGGMRDGVLVSKETIMGAKLQGTKLYGKDAADLVAAGEELVVVPGASYVIGEDGNLTVENLQMGGKSFPINVPSTAITSLIDRGAKDALRGLGTKQEDPTLYDEAGNEVIPTQVTGDTYEVQQQKKKNPNEVFYE